MGLFDSIAGQVLGSLSSSGDARHNGLVEAIGGLINNQQTGGLAGLVSLFEQKGIGGVVASWVGTGQNLPISAEQLESVIGSEQVRAIAQKLGFTPQEVSGHLAELLPQVVDKLTPGGSVSGSGALGGLLGMLGGAGADPEGHADVPQ
jgi:uncharacterized protein YidB (DUF937 family)